MCLNCNKIFYHLFVVFCGTKDGASTLSDIFSDDYLVFPRLRRSIKKYPSAIKIPVTEMAPTTIKIVTQKFDRLELDFAASFSSASF